MNVTDESRKAFEQAIANKPTAIDFDFTLDNKGEYCSSRMRLMWWAWQKSREVAVVKLPEDLTPEYEGDDFKNISDAAYCRGYNQAMREAELAIEAAGIKVVSK